MKRGIMQVELYCKKCGKEGNENFCTSKVAKYKRPGRKSNYCKECQKEVDKVRRASKGTTNKVIECRQCGVKGGNELFTPSRFKLANKYLTCNKCRRKHQSKTINYRIRKNMSNRIKSAFKRYKDLKKDYGTMQMYVGCDMYTFFKHIEDQWTEGMSWDNYGKWHLDHIRPIASFDLTKDEEVKACFNYKNVQPLWAEDNLKKGDKYEE